MIHAAVESALRGPLNVTEEKKKGFLGLLGLSSCNLCSLLREHFQWERKLGSIKYQVGTCNLKDEFI